MQEVGLRDEPSLGGSVRAIAATTAGHIVLGGSRGIVLLRQQPLREQVT